MMVEWSSDDGNFLLAAISISTSSGLPGPILFRTTDSRLSGDKDECIVVLDGGARVVAIGEDARWGGTFGEAYSTDGTDTVPAKLFESVQVGSYVMRDSLDVENDDDSDSDSDNGDNDLFIHYRTFVPMETTPYGSISLDCELMSELGDGRMVGAFRADPNVDEDGDIVSFRLRDYQTLQLDKDLGGTSSSCPVNEDGSD